MINERVMINEKNMLVLKRRSRLVTFRVSAEEHDALMRSCVASGARSIADFARASVLHTAQRMDSPSATLSGDLSTLSKSLGELDASLNEIRKRIRGVLGIPMDGNGNGGNGGNANGSDSRDGARARSQRAGE